MIIVRIGTRLYDDKYLGRDATSAAVWRSGDEGRRTATLFRDQTEADDFIARWQINVGSYKITYERVDNVP